LQVRESGDHPVFFKFLLLTHLVAPGATQLSHKDLKRVLITEAEAHGIIQALIGNRNNKTKTAKQLGMTHRAGVTSLVAIVNTPLTDVHFYEQSSGL